MHPALAQQSTEQVRMDGFTTKLDVTHRYRQWQDRAGWIWRWDREAKQWAGYADGEYQIHLPEHQLNDYCDGRGYRPFIAVD